MKDDLKISFVIPGYKCDGVVFRNVDSLFDQDYKNWEAIAVLNGQWETKGELIKRLHEKYGDKIKVHSLEVGNLAGANNYGFNHSTGDIISHLSSDLYLMPGAARRWIEAFQENPDCGMVYSGYRFVSNDPSQVYHSEPFNRHHLECENFIDGANPVRRTNWKEWNPTLKSLIDWDFALSVTDDGTKAYFINEPLYFAELPKPGGLSYDSNRYWITRCKRVRELHNIPWRDICITSLNNHDYALKLAELLDIDFKTNPGFKPHEYKLIYVYGFDCTDMNIQYNTSFFNNHPGHKIIHWTGTDLRSLMNLRWIDVDYYVQAVLKRIDNHFCFSPIHEKILAKMGLEPEIVYPPMSYPVAEIERKLSCISCNDAELMEQLKKAMPDYEFKRDVLSCFLTVHFEDNVDNIIRSICMGNIVISNTEIKGASYIQGFTNIPDLRKMVVHEIRNCIRAKAEPDKELINRYLNQTNPENFKKKLRRIADKKFYKYGKLEDVVANA